MVIYYNKDINYKTAVIGEGLVDKIINALPIELHLPGYQYCGPGTKLQQRLNRGDKGINQLDSACKEHDIAYSKSKDINIRHQADKILENRAWERVLSKDSGLSEKSFAYLVANAMKAKRKLGMGLEKKKLKKVSKVKKTLGRKLFNTTVKTATKILRKEKPQDINSAIRIARKVINNSFKGKKSQVTIPRIINVPKIGGFLPLIPILTALGAIGSLSTGGAAIAKAVNAAKNAKNQLDEATRHNKTMEAIAMGKGLYLKPYKKGYGLIYKENSKNDIKHFRGTFMLDSLPKRPRNKECGIINLDSSTGSGTHWVAYYKDNQQIEYFDSFGNLQPPLELIKYLGKNIKYNYIKHQNYNSFNCGHLCLEFLFNKSERKK
ncbi:Capsid protein VP1 [Lucilia cuprina]|nr:Capsid protein VP1 [Lucilia cuprina]